MWRVTCLGDIHMFTRPGFVRWTFLLVCPALLAIALTGCSRHQATPVLKTVHEELVREEGAWRIRVW